MQRNKYLDNFVKTKTILLIYSRDYKRWAFKDPEAKENIQKDRERIMGAALDFLEDVPFGMEIVKFPKCPVCACEVACCISTWKPVLL